MTSPLNLVRRFPVDGDATPGDEDVMASLTLRIHKSGAMSVAGDIHDERFALTMLDAARDSIKSHHRRINERGLIIPKVV